MFETIIVGSTISRVPRKSVCNSSFVASTRMLVESVNAVGDMTAAHRVVPQSVTNGSWNEHNQSTDGIYGRNTSPPSA